MACRGLSLILSEGRQIRHSDLPTRNTWALLLLCLLLWHKEGTKLTVVAYHYLSQSVYPSLQTGPHTNVGLKPVVHA